jgi:hypothetical protein
MEQLIQELWLPFGQPCLVLTLGHFSSSSFFLSWSKLLLLPTLTLSQGRVHMQMFRLLRFHPASRVACPLFHVADILWSVL